MKVIITKECQYGNIGEIKEVKSGFALNFLLPQQLVEKATDKSIAFWQSRKEVQAKVVAKKAVAKDKLIEQIRNKVVKISAKANESDILYAAIHEKELRVAIENQLGLDLGNYKIKLLSNIKKLGNQEAKININSEIVDIKINITKGDDQN